MKTRLARLTREVSRFKTAPRPFQTAAQNRALRNWRIAKKLAAHEAAARRLRRRRADEETRKRNNAMAARNDSCFFGIFNRNRRAPPRRTGLANANGWCKFND